jgi:hypothetical protein
MAFTLPPEPAGFVVLCQLAQRLSLICGFCPSARTFALRLPSDDFSRNRPCLRLILLLVSIIMNTLRLSYRGLSPHKLTPMPGVHLSIERTRNNLLFFSVPSSLLSSFLASHFCCYEIASIYAINPMLQPLNQQTKKEAVL